MQVNTIDNYENSQDVYKVFRLPYLLVPALLRLGAFVVEINNYAESILPLIAEQRNGESSSHLSLPGFHVRMCLEIDTGWSNVLLCPTIWLQLLSKALKFTCTLLKN